MFSGLRGSKKVAPEVQLKSADSFSKENLDDLLSKIDDAEGKQTQLPRGKSVKNVDELLQRIDEVEASPLKKSHVNLEEESGRSRIAPLENVGVVQDVTLSGSQDKEDIAETKPSRSFKKPAVSRKIISTGKVAQDTPSLNGGTLSSKAKPVVDIDTSAAAKETPTQQIFRKESSAKMLPPLQQQASVKNVVQVVKSESKKVVVPISTKEEVMVAPVASSPAVPSLVEPSVIDGQGRSTKALNTAGEGEPPKKQPKGDLRRKSMSDDTKQSASPPRRTISELQAKFDDLTREESVVASPGATKVVAPSNSPVEAAAGRAAVTTPPKTSLAPAVVIDDAAEKEARAAELKLREQVDERFKVLMSQVLEFHIKMREMSSRLNEYESLRGDMETSIEDLERQNMLLSNKLNNRDSSLSTVHSRSEKIARGNDARRNALLFEASQEEFTFKFDEKARKKSDGYLAQLEKQFVEALPFSADVRKIQSRFGTSVAAYFDFYRFLFVQFSMVASVCAVLAGFHFATLIRNGGDIRIFSSKGAAPGFVKFSSFTPDENLLYSSVIVSGCIIFICTLFFQVIHKDRMAKELDALEKQSDTTYAKNVLCVWDFTLVSKRQQDEFAGVTAQELLQKISDEQVGKEEKKRTNYDIALLLLKRIVGWLFYLGLQLGAAALIIYITVSATSINGNVSGVKELSALAPFFSAITLSFINSFVPFVCKYVTAFEAWDTPTIELNYLLGRMYFSNIFNILILAGTYALLADPLLLAETELNSYRRLLEITFAPSTHRCRMDQVADGLFSLLLTAFGLKMLIVILNPLSDYIYALVFEIPYEKTAFDIASSIISMLYLATIAMLIFPYAPITIIIVPIMLAILIKWEKWVLLHFYRAPKRPWKAQKAGVVFSIFYLVSFFVVGFPSSTFFFSIATFPKSCEIQDAFINLCESNSYNATSQSCSALNTRSSYYDLYSNPSYCVGGYPSCICSSACGPFTLDSTNIAPFRTSILSIYGLDIVWAGLFTYPYGPWLLVSVFFLIAFLVANTMNVQYKVFAMKEQAMSSRIDALEASNKEKEKRLQKIKAFEARSSAHESFIVQTEKVKF